MPPILALILCSIFVFWLLRIERKQSPNVSLVTWLPAIWMLSIASKPLIGSAADESGGSPLDRNFQSAILIIGIIIVFSRRVKWLEILKNNLPLMLLISYMLVSILWSDIQYTSFKRWVRQLSVIVIAMVIMAEESPRFALESIMRRVFYILIPFSLLLIKYYTYLGVDYTAWSGGSMWIGVTTHKNSLGILCMMAAFFIIWSRIYRWRIHNISTNRYHVIADMIVLFLTFWLLKGSGSSYSVTSIGTLVFGLFTLYSILWLKKRQVNINGTLLMIIAFIIICYGVLTPLLGGTTMGNISGALGRDNTLTGRTDVWAQLVPVAMQYPLLGRGYGSFWTAETKELYHISGAHNGYLEVLLELGFTGIFFYIIFFLSACRKATNDLTHNIYWGIFSICLIFMALLHNITESSLNSLAMLQTVLIVILTIIAQSTNHTNQDSMNIKND
jgi:exopolysaccharide production protein ExoQ